MNEKRLIDANAFASKITPQSGCPILKVSEVLQAIEAAPTIEAVEVVRCCDCQLGEFNLIDQGYWEPPACDGVKCGKHGGIVMDFTDYCSFGKRKEAAHDL
jgi:hypothetical protein